MLIKHISFAVRLVFASGFAALAAACLYIFNVTAPDWFGRAVYQSCAGAGLILLVLWGGAECVMRHKHSTRWRIWLLGVALAAVLTPWLYVLPGAVYGLDAADIQTWHLFPLFIMGRIAAPVFLFGVILPISLFMFKFTHRIFFTPLGRN